jgi:hypothetical protein
MAPKLKYDPTYNRATLVSHHAGWYLWLDRPGEGPAHMHVEARERVRDAIGASQLSNERVIGYFERRLFEAGYLTTLDASQFDDVFATWALGPFDAA